MKHYGSSTDNCSFSQCNAAKNLRSRVKNTFVLDCVGYKVVPTMSLRPPTVTPLNIVTRLPMTAPAPITISCGCGKEIPNPIGFWQSHNMKLLLNMRHILSLKN